MWKIYAGGLQIHSGTESECCGVYLGYNEWRAWNKGEGAAASLRAIVGSHPATWSLPVELVDPAGNPKARTGADPT